MIVQHQPIRSACPDDDWHYWFGYYDKCPWSPDGSKLLAHRARFCDRFPEPGDSAQVGYITDWQTDTPRFTAVGTTRAWNWQQGAMLRWVADDLGLAIRFNDRNPDADPTREDSLVTQQVRFDPTGTPTEPQPIGPAVYTQHSKTGTALSVSFARLSRLRPEYGYPGLIDPHANDPSPNEDGIYKVGPVEREMIISIDQLDRVTPDGTGRAGAARHQHVNHLMFNPSGSRFCFMHRFERDDGILQSRLFTANPDGSDLRLLFEGMCSHYDWRDDETILAWAGKRALLGSASSKKSPTQRVMTSARRMLKPVYYALGKPRLLMNKIMKDSYLLIRDMDCRQTDAPPPEPFAKGILTCDGHCTFGRCGREPGRWVLTDGYPDLKSRQPLFLWDCQQNKGYEIGRYATPRHLDGPIRVDLHPRFNHDATKVCIDSAMTGNRAMYVVDVNAISG